jgi:hypothetical protein
MSRQLFTIVVLLLPLAALAQDKAPSGEKAKEFATDAMQKAGVKDGRVVETQHLVLATALAEPKAKALADSLDKTFVTAHKAVKIDLADLKTKTVVFAFAELDQYRQFKRSVIKERPDDDETASFDMRRDDAFVAVSARRGDKNPNFDLLAANEMCRGVLAKKGGNARLSDWMKDGFARAVTWRSDPKTAATDRAAVSRLAPRLPKGAKSPMPAVEKAWSGLGREKELIAASLMDYLTFGPGSEKLSGLLSAMVPTAGIDEPMFADALRATEWMVDDLDRAWREWLAKGSPAGK